MTPKPQLGRLVGRDLGMVESSDDIEANTTSLWKNSSRSKPTAILSASRFQPGSWMVGHGAESEADGPGVRQVRGDRQVVPETEKGELALGASND